MKPNYSGTLFLLLLPLLVQAQGLVTLTLPGGGVVNGTMVHKPLTPGYIQDTVKVVVQLSGNTPRQVKVRRHEIWPLAGTQNFFCWDVCYIPFNNGTYPTFVCQDPVNMQPGVQYTEFGAYHIANGQAAAAGYRYVWYDASNPAGADSSWVDIVFGGQVGVAEAVAGATLQIAPNPVIGPEAMLTFATGRLHLGLEAVVYNALGERVQRFGLVGSEGRTAIRTEGLGTGLYFVNLESGGKVLGTRRMVVAR